MIISLSIGFGGYVFDLDHAHAKFNPTSTIPFNNRGQRPIGFLKHSAIVLFLPPSRKTKGLPGRDGKLIGTDSFQQKNKKGRTLFLIKQESVLGKPIHSMLNVCFNSSTFPSQYSKASVAQTRIIGVTSPGPQGLLYFLIFPPGITNSQVSGATSSSPG